MFKGLYSPEVGFEVRRQLVHMTGGVLISVLAYILKPAYGVWVVLPVLAGVLAFLAIPRLIPDLSLSNHLLFRFERREDLKVFPYKGAVYFGAGIIFPLLLLPTGPACAVIIVLSVGDAFSTMAGKYFRRTTYTRKTFEGAAAFFLTSFAAALFYVDARVAFVFAFAGMLAELKPVINDNLEIPLALTILYMLIFRTPAAF